MEYKILNRQGKHVDTILIDKEDIDLVNSYQWTPTRRGYMQSKKSQDETGYLQMHRLIMNAPLGLVINHINGNTRDNRRENLEIVTQKTNTRKRKNTKGVYWDEKRKKWNAKIGVNYKNINLGYFNTYDEALEKRKQAESKEWKDV